MQTVIVSSIVFVIAVGLTIWYFRKNKKSLNTINSGIDKAEKVIDSLKNKDQN